MHARPESAGRRRRLVWLWPLGVLLAVAVALVLGAWLASPPGNDLPEHLKQRLRQVGSPEVALSRIAPILREAVVATEDERFYRHHGIDVVGVIRAVPYDATHLSLAQGASTITEQVAKILYLNGNDHSPWLKLKDAALALKLETHYSKEQILGAYLDSAYFGHGAYGAWAASERYFGVPPARLSLAQASLLAGLIQAPSAYDPLTHPAAARERQVDVLRSLLRNGFTTNEEAAAVLRHELRLSGARLAPLLGVDLAAGPPFVWWELALGASLALLGGAAFAVVPRLHLPLLTGRFAVTALSLSLVLAGVAVVARSFRTA
jgi:hypothetical protein